MARLNVRRKPPAYINASRRHLAPAVRRFARGTKRGMLVLDAGAGQVAVPQALQARDVRSG